MDTITIKKPDDFHVHLRDGAMLQAVLPYTARVFARALVMPNLSPEPVTTTERLLAYRDRILQYSTVSFPAFTPLMSYYLTDTSDAEEIARGYQEGIAAAVKMYPAGATTNSALGVTDIERVYGVFEKMQTVGMPLLVHGEALIDKHGNAIDPYDREKVFLEDTLTPLLKNFPTLKVVLEHATTKEAVQFIRNEQSKRLGATFTVQHLALTRDDMFDGGLQPHHYCLPVIKRTEHREALREAATSGEPYFFLGTDSAPHPTYAKERAVGCAAGMFTAPSALESYTQIFEEMNALHHFEAFASLNGARFYGLPENTETVTLTKRPWTIDEVTSVSNGDNIRPFGYHEIEEKRHIHVWSIES